MKKTDRKLDLKINVRGRTLRLSLNYLRENWGAPFVVGFQVLLLSCAGLLIQGNSGLADEVAVYAYYLLVVGVVLQLVSYLRYGRGEDAVE